MIKDTGKYEGVQKRGEGNWTACGMRPQQSYIEAQGEMETP
jgi:hypothetical protein